MKKARKRKKYNVARCLLALALFLLILLVVIVSKSRSTTDAVSKTKLESQVQVITEYNFIREIAPYAQEGQKSHKVLSSLTLAQACLESNFGQSTLASKYHNLFGIKAYGNVPTVSLDTQEYLDGQWLTLKGSFRVYDNWEDSVLGHTKLFVLGTTWNPNQYASVLAAKNYEAAAKAVQSSGYATDPDYADKLISIIKEFNLEQYDKV